MGGVKVTMAIPYPSLCQSLVKQGSIFTGKAIGVILDALVFISGDGDADIFFRLGEVLLGILGDSIEVAKGADSGIGFTGG